MTTVGLCDTVTVVRHPGIQDQLICDTPVTARAEDNLCMKALRLFFQELGVKEDFVTITLQKRIPAQAGLGGGSSDAAAVLRALRTLYAAMYRSSSGAVRRWQRAGAKSCRPCRICRPAGW